MDNKMKGAILLAIIVVAGLPAVIHLVQRNTQVAQATAPAPVQPVGQADSAQQPVSRTGATWGRAFETDPDAIGGWRTVDFVRNIEDFEPGKRGWTGDFAFERLKFLADGHTSGPWSWTKGHLWHPGDRAEGKYEIRELGGAKYLFMEWISGDVLIRGQKPQYYVFQQE